MNELIKNSVKVSWAELGEGLYGDYDPNYADDIELLRFDVDKFVNGEWEAVEDCSYCTQIPITATPEQRQSALEWIMSEVYEPITEGYSPKKICEFLSWISLASLKTGKIDHVMYKGG